MEELNLESEGKVESKMYETDLNSQKLNIGSIALLLHNTLK